MSDTPKQKPQQLEMHKRTITMKDGKREMTFYTFTDRVQSSTKKEDKKK